MSGGNERDSQIAASLSNAGIGRAFHQRTLASLGPNGEKLLEWTKTVGKKELAMGHGWNVVGPNANSYATFIVLARAIHLSGCMVRVVPLRRLVSQLIHNGDMLPELEECGAIFVTDFYQVYKGVDSVMHGREVQEVEMFLTERLDNKKPMFLHSANSLTSANWWSAGFLQRVAEHNRNMEVTQ